MRSSRFVLVLSPPLTLAVGLLELLVRKKLGSIGFAMPPEADN
jgi:hypothetical protein